MAKKYFHAKQSEAKHFKGMFLHEIKVISKGKIAKKGKNRNAWRPGLTKLSAYSVEYPEIICTHTKFHSLICFCFDTQRYIHETSKRI